MQLRKVGEKKLEILLVKNGTENFSLQIFIVEESFNKESDRVYARSSKEAAELVYRV